MQKNREKRTEAQVRGAIIDTMVLAIKHEAGKTKGAKYGTKELIEGADRELLGMAEKLQGECEELGMEEGFSMLAWLLDTYKGAKKEEK